MLNALREDEFEALETVVDAASVNNMPEVRAAVALLRESIQRHKARFPTPVCAPENFPHRR